MQVICPSYGRTGTNSMRVALEILGFGPCYHMFQLISKHMNTHPKLWIDGYEGRGLPVAEIFDGYGSVADWPAADFYKEIMQEYPDAKVIVTLRDADSWWKSVIGSIHSDGPHEHAWGQFFMEVLSPWYRRYCVMGWKIATLNMAEKEAKTDYIRHIAEVKAHVPADKLLEFSVKEGWEPLCAFLGVPVPDVPFPWTNSAGEIQNHYDRLNRRGWIMMLGVLTAGGVSLGVASYFGGKRAGGGLAAIELSALSCSVIGAMRVRRHRTNEKKH